VELLCAQLEVFDAEYVAAALDALADLYQAAKRLRRSSGRSARDSEEVEEAVVDLLGPLALHPAARVAQAAGKLEQLLVNHVYF
jgi:hypothetical protein